MNMSVLWKIEGVEKMVEGVQKGCSSLIKM